MPLGFCITKGDELYQIYVSAEARGSRAAVALMADAEDRLIKSGVETAWLACAIGNERAARFYEKCGWRRVGVAVYQAETSTATFSLEVWRYEKTLTPISPRGRDKVTIRAVRVLKEKFVLSVFADSL